MRNPRTHDAQMAPSMGSHGTRTEPRRSRPHHPGTPGGTVTETQRALIAALEAIRPEPAPEPTTAAALSAALSRAAADEIGHPDQATTENGSTS
jgi:hypothetical protein